MRYQESQLQESNRDSTALTDVQALMTKKGFPEDEVTLFAEKTERILDKCAEHYGAGTQFQYQVIRYLGRVKLRITLPGDDCDLLTDEDTNNRVLDYVEQAFLKDESSFASQKKTSGQEHYYCKFGAKT